MNFEGVPYARVRALQSFDQLLSDAKRHQAKAKGARPGPSSLQME
jgi:hypothetical protein